MSDTIGGVIQDGGGAGGGGGSLIKTGTGILNLTGVNTYTGATQVTAGTLSVNGSIASSSLTTVEAGGTLGGNGTVGVTMVHTGGIIAPGNSIGTLHINGPYAQQAGSTYQVQLDPNSNASDLIAVNGAATLQAGSNLSATKIGPGNYLPGAIYNVLNATGGVTGTYALTGDTAVSAFLNLVDSYDANNVYLKVVQTGDPGDAAQTPNQTSTAGGIGGTALEIPVLNSPSDAAAREALDQLSGAGYASAKGAMIYDSRYTRALAIDRLRDAFCTVGHSSRSDAAARPGEPVAASGCATNPDRFAVWGQAFGSWGHSSGNANAARIDRSSGGFVTGIDTSIANSWRVGLLTGYSRSSYSVDAQHASSDSDDYHFGLYGGTQWSNLAFRFGGTYTWHDITSARSVVLPAFFNRLSADYNASTAQVFGELGYQIAAGQFGFEPFANLAYVNLHSNGFVERGGAAALTSRGGDTGTAFTTLGLRASTDFALGNVKTTARGTLGWLHAYGDITPVSVMSFAGGNSFTVTGVPIATDAAVVEAGLDLHVTREATLGISYGGQFGGSAIDQSVRGNFTMRF
jgi:outer membrane autotransporter protein